jgi:hypothetical protein
MRISKQLSYGALYIVIFALIGGGVYTITNGGGATCFDNKKNQNETEIDCGGSCAPCFIKNAELGVSGPEFLPAGDELITLFYEISNSVDYGAKFEYRIDLKGSLGGIVESVEGASSVEPNGIRYVVIPGINIARADVSAAEFVFTRVNWNESPGLGTLLVEQRGVQTSIVGSEARVVGRLLNLTNEVIEAVRATAVLSDENGEVVNASATELKNVRVAGETQFTIFLPVTESITPDSEPIRTRVFLEVIPSL